MGEFCMPTLGADMDAGTVTEWLVHPGDAVKRGDIVAVVETDKAELDVEVFESGVVTELLVPTGVRVAVGTPLARISVGVDAAVGAVPATGPPAVAAAPPPAPHPSTPTQPVHAPTLVQQPPVVGPLIRHLAETSHVDLATVPGTGQGGRVTRADVTAAAERAGRPRRRVTPRARRLARRLGVSLDDVHTSGAVTGTAVERLADTALSPEHRPRVDSRRAAIARLMSRSGREIPHYYVSTRIPLDTTLTHVAERNAALPISERILPAAALLRAVAQAATTVPELNGLWVDDAFQPSDGVHLGVAVSMRDGGLLTPTIAGADTLDLDALMAMLRDLVNRARSGRLRSKEMGGASMTVTNLGEQGVEAVFGVIVPPQVALVGFGRIHEEPWAEEGMVGVRQVVHASLAADHRATDGRIGARFLDALAGALQHPEDL
jgi:pyruvate dehydrogenase E2 component (dihydrolipoamide acetyltransferase)